jgi:hypothetical protein
MDKKIVILSALMLPSAFSSCVDQKYNPESDFVVNIIDNGTAVEITRYVGGEPINIFTRIQDLFVGRRVRIPPRIQGLPVALIGERAFAHNRLVSVVIPDSVTHIGDRAFLNNRLVSVVIPDSVTHIGNVAFADNQLVSIVIPDSVTHIGRGAFENNRLTDVIIPASVTHIGDRAFCEQPAYRHYYSRQRYTYRRLGVYTQPNYRYHHLQ